MVSCSSELSSCSSTESFASITSFGLKMSIIPGVSFAERDRLKEVMDFSLLSVSREGTLFLLILDALCLISYVGLLRTGSDVFRLSLHLLIGTSIFVSALD